MEEKKAETRTTETITISRAEYDAQKAQIAELKSQNEWLMEQLRLLRKKQFGASSEQTSEDGMEQLSLLFNEAEVYADQEAKTAEEAEDSVSIPRSSAWRWTLTEAAEKIV